ncbi:hypothetical protein [Mucilaginibacter glaciei]|uniref:Integrase catalytic domain-containing protein n=1 Tax=Mucilaginibacter glaciei TaxID=2772109 RepID=A0A926NT87_9SPHI|nr:hypothetical protein [Mucilaginibacter glaciei]MBD1394295.1 hypothetical protein [Mucilaginibacter glaciei]
MPSFWNNTVVVTKDELKPWYSDNNLKTTIQRYKEKSYGIKRVQRAHLGSPMLISYDSLPKEIQDALGDPRKCDHILERFYKVDGGAVNYYKTFRFESDGSYLDLEFQERYIINASVLEAVKALKEVRERERKTKGISLHGVNTTLWEDAVSFQATLKAKYSLQHTLPENNRSFIEVFKKYELDGYITLISGKHKNQNTRKVTDKTLELLNNMFGGDKRKPTATDVHKRYDAFIGGYVSVVNNDTSEIYNPAEFKKLSDTTVKKYMSQWANKIGTYQHRSTDREKLMTQFKPHHSLNKPKFAGSIISIDDRQPPFKDLSGKRVWFYNGIDLGSEAFTCSVYGDSKDGIIMEFYRQLVRNYHHWGFHLPAELECEMSLNSSFKDTFLREGEMFQYVRIEANNPRGKRIERYFRTLRYEYEKDKEGWLARPHAKSENNQAVTDSEKIPRLPYEKIVDNAIDDIETWNSRKHSVHTHMTRWEVFCEMQHPDIKPTNYIGILPYIGYHTKTSCNVGIIRLQRKEFLLGNEGKISLGDRLIGLMKQVEGQEISIYWLDDHEGQVFKALVFIGTQYICEAIAKPVYGRATIEQTPEDYTARSIMSAYVATIDSYGRRRKQQIEPVTIINNTPPEPKTFTMPGMRGLQARLIGSGEILPEFEEAEVENIPSQSFRKSLKDRF